MISRLTADIPRFHENLRFVVLPFVVNTADGKLSAFVIPNNSGFALADFVNRPTGNPHECTGPLRVVDGQARVAVELANAVIAAEQGEPSEEWPGPTLGSLSVRGIAMDGRFWVGRTTGVTEDGRSLTFEMGVSDKAGLPALIELAQWAI